MCCLFSLTYSLIQIPKKSSIINISIIRQKENLTQSETVANKSPKDTPTKSRKNNKDVIKKKDENAKDEKQEANVQQQANALLVNNKETVKEIKEQQKETPVKEIKEAVKETTSTMPPTKESKKTKKKNDILAQIGKILFLFL